VRSISVDRTFARQLQYPLSGWRTKRMKLEATRSAASVLHHSRVHLHRATTVHVNARSGRRRAARATTTASRTRAAPATGSTAKCSMAATRNPRPGSCTGCSAEVSKGSSIVPRYAELQVTTNFSFLRGASHGEELVGGLRHLLVLVPCACRHTSRASSSPRSRSRNTCLTSCRRGR
jgi:hypothetical protein